MSSQTILYQFWERTITPAAAQEERSGGEWEEQVRCLSQHGRSIEETLKYLYEQRPSFDMFIDWIAFTGKPVSQEYTGGQILTEDDMAFWNSNGYIVIKNAVSQEQCAAARDAIWDFLNASPGSPESWYRDHPGMNGMMLHLTQHPALDANRISSKIRQVYSELYGETEIFQLIDKVSFNPPANGRSIFRGSPLHWDVSLQLPIPFVLQGLLYLTDTAETDGAFHCVPGFHNEVGNWLQQLPKDVNPREAAIRELKPVAVPGTAGDLVIWHQALPHCATPNNGTQPRMVQYIAYKPVKTRTAEVWI